MKHLQSPFKISAWKVTPPLCLFPLPSFLSPRNIAPNCIAA